MVDNLQQLDLTRNFEMQNLFMYSSTGDVEVAEPPKDVVSNKVEEAEVVDEKVEEPQTRTTYNIVFVSAEAAPYSKTGGLGDVCGSLPIVLASRGHRVMVVSPRYLTGTAADKKFAGVVDTETRIKVPCFGGEHEVAFFHEYREGVDWVRNQPAFLVGTSLFISYSSYRVFLKHN